MINRISKENFDSAHLYNEMLKIEDEVSLKFLEGLKWMDNNVDAVVIGGTAVCHYLQSRSLTPDIDFITDEIDKIKNLLDRDDVNYTALASNWGNPLGIHIPSFEIDILDSDSGNKELNNYIIHKGFLNRMIAGYNIKVASPEAMCLMKFNTGGRLKDEMDAFALLQSGVLNKTTYLNIISDLFSSLNEADILKRYAGIIK